MFKYLLLLAVLGSVVSCDFGQKEEVRDDRLKGTEPIGGVRELNGDEEAIVKIICESLRDKRNYLSTLLDNTLHMTIAVSEKDCRDQGLRTPTTIEASVAGNSTGDFRIESNYRGTRFSDLVIDNKGMAYPLCRNFFNGSKLENIIKYDGAKYKYRVLPQNREQVVLEAAVYLNDNAPSSIEQAFIWTEGEMNGVPKVGMVETRSKLVKCSGGGDRVIRHELKSARE